MPSEIFEGTFEWVKIVTSKSCFYVKEQIIYHTISASQGGSNDNDIVIITDGNLVENEGGYSGTSNLFPYIISGRIRNISGVLQADKVVKAYNKATKEFITTKTNSDGVYAIDCANFSSGYSDGDIIELTAGLALRVYKATLSYTISGGSKGADIVFQMTTDGVSWEDCQDGIEHSFSETGADLRWRAAGSTNIGIYLTDVIISYDTNL